MAGGAGGCRVTAGNLRRVRLCSLAVLTPSQPNWTVSGDGEANGRSRLSLQPNDVSRGANTAAQTATSSHAP